MIKKILFAAFMVVTSIQLLAQNRSGNDAPHHHPMPQTIGTIPELKVFRQHIDSLDTESINLLAKRMHICLAVGQYKKQHGVAVVQSERYHEILERRSQQGGSKGLSENFVQKLFELIHTESVRQQQELIGNKYTLHYGNYRSVMGV